MPRGRSTFSKRQKEQARQQHQKDKALRRTERKQSKPEGATDEMAELQEHAAAQAALFHVSHDDNSHDSPSDDRGEHENS